MTNPIARKTLVLILSWCVPIAWNIHARMPERKPLTLEYCIGIALNESIDAREAANRFMTDYVEYKLYKISRLPVFSLQTTPLQYNSSYTQRYDFNENIDIYRRQNSLYSSLGINIKQNLAFTGGTLSLDTNLDYLNNTSANSYSQFSSIPIRIGYNQSLFGFNRFKWDKKLKPLKYRIAEKQYLYTLETIVEKTASYFFDYAIAQKEYEMAMENMLSADTLYMSGTEHDRISAISPADINILYLDRQNAKNSAKTAKAAVDRAGRALAAFLGIESTSFSDTGVKLPVEVKQLDINYDNVIAIAMENNPQELMNEQTLLQAEMDLRRTKRESGFNANISASIGFNQIGARFTDVYNNLSRQSVFGINISVPIFDWGDRKGRISIADNNMKSAELSVTRNRRDLKSELETIIDEITIYREMIIDSEEILDLAESAYEITKRRFLAGKSDTNTLTLALSRKTEAMRNYLSLLKNYWSAYYKIRRLTLYDFENRKQLSVSHENLISAYGQKHRRARVTAPDI